MDTQVSTEIIHKLGALPANLQWQVLVFIDTLQVSPGREAFTPQMRQFSGEMSAEDLAALQL